MSLGVVVDVALGLAFVFTVLAIIASSIQEIIASVLSTRGKVLHGMLVQILSDVAAQPGAGRPVLAAPPAAATTPDLATRVIGHPLIDSLATPNLPARLSRLLNSVKLPSYVPSTNFATALIEILREGHDETLAVGSQLSRGIALLPDNSPVKRSLQGFIVEAKGDVDAFRSRVQTWYDDAMDRASGVYKRYAQYTLLGIGLLLAIAVNADVIAIADTLWRDQSVRNLVDSAAAQYVTNAPQNAPTTSGQTPTSSGAPSANSSSAPAPDVKVSLSRMKDAGQLIAQLPIPLGWSGTAEEARPVGFLAWVVLVARKTLGFLLVAFAVSLGAPFWFDALQNIANLRGSGPKPDRAGADSGT